MATPPTGAADGKARQSAVPRRRFSWRIKVAMVFASLLFAVAIAEAAIRMFVPVTDVPFMFWDPLIGPRRAPNQQGHYYFGKEISGKYRFNAQGWNNIHDYSGAKPKGTRRVCLVGDSFVEAINLDIEKTMASQAEQIMSRPDRPVEWYSLGNSGFGTSHEYLAIHHYVLDYKPDAVVLFFVCNDPIDSSPYLANQEPWMAAFELDDTGGLVYRPPAQYFPSVLRRFASQSALVRYLMIQKGLFAPRAAVPTGGLSVREFAGIVGDSRQAASLTLAQKIDKTWLLIGALLKQIKMECEARGAVFLLVFQGHRDQIEAAAAGRAYVSPDMSVDRYCQDQRINDMGSQYLEPLCKRMGINYLDLTEPLISAVKSAGRRHNYVDDAHFNELGHRAAAEAMAGKLEELWAKPRAKR